MCLEDREEALAGTAVPLDGRHEPFGRAVVSSGKVGAHQAFLVAEQVVEGCLGDPRVFDDSIDADGLDALGVEQFGR